MPGVVYRVRKVETPKSGQAMRHYEARAMRGKKYKVPRSESPPFNHKDTL
jgi:hypothetical protein